MSAALAAPGGQLLPPCSSTVGAQRHQWAASEAAELARRFGGISVTARI